MIFVNPNSKFPVDLLKEELSSFSNGLVLIDKNLGFEVTSDLETQFFPFPVKLLEGGEALKTLDVAKSLFEEMAELSLDRHSFILAIGGGALLDLTGFLAACFMRGIAFFSVPTTLLSQVDACYGGKTGLNLKNGKNLVGAFYQPQKIWIYTPFLLTQDPNGFYSGFAEIIKYGVIDDPLLFQLLEEKKEAYLKRDLNELTFLIERSLSVKKKIVLLDEKEAGVRAFLNFGHTIGHAIEAATEYKQFTHGQAVAIGMCLEAKMSVERGLFSQKEWERLVALCQAFHLPTEYSSFEELIPFLKKDKKNKGGKVGFVLPKRLGDVEMFQITL